MPEKKQKKITKTQQRQPSKTFSVPIYASDGVQSESISVPHEIFNVKASDKLLSQYVYVYLQNQRAGTANSKTRGQITGSTRKIYRQKGTGRARHGDRYAPIFVGGGVAHGPKAYKRHRSLNKKQRRKALFYALSLRLKDQDIMILNNIDKLEGKTREVMAIMEQTKLSLSSSVLFIYHPQTDGQLVKAVGNIANSSTLAAESINAYEVLRNDKLVFSTKGLEIFLAKYNKNEKK